jgi:hypothetical protein
VLEAEPFIFFGSVCRRFAMPVITPWFGNRYMSEKTFWRFVGGLFAATLVTSVTVSVTIVSLLMAI